MMNPAELKELAAVLTGIADRKPWQMRSSENVEWGLASDGADPMDVMKAGFQIRLKPWGLGRSINGHTLPDGAEWHRQDFPEDMLPAPYRPLMDGEERFGDDEVFGFTNKGPWIKCSELKSRFHDREVGRQHNLSRTTRPIPFAITSEQIAEGWLPWSGGECPVEPESRPQYMMRSGKTHLSGDEEAKRLRWIHNGFYGDIVAYRPDPYGHLRQALADGKEIEHQANVGGQWYSLINAMEVDFMSPPEAYRIKPEPQWLPLGPEDVPPGSVVRKNDWPEGTWEVVHGTEVTGINWDEENEKFDSIMEDWLINRPRHRDADGNPTLWEECRKPAP